MFYLIEHNRTTKETSCTEFGDYYLAQATVLQKEQDYFHGGHHEMEVVVFEANSLDDLKRTHSRYFVAESKNENGSGALVAIGLIGLALFLMKKK